MACELLRSCYSTVARLHADEPTRETQIYWYWTSVGANPLPITSSVNSLNWMDATERTAAARPSGIGEVPERPRPWRNGALKPGPQPLALEPCGEDAWFTDGTPAGISIQRGTNGIALACAVPQGSGRAVGLTGAAVWSWEERLVPSPCPDGPSSIPAGFVAVADSFPVIDGHDPNGAYVCERCDPDDTSLPFVGFRVDPAGGWWALIIDWVCGPKGGGPIPRGDANMTLNGDGTSTFSGSGISKSSTGTCEGFIFGSLLRGNVTVPTAAEFLP